MPCVRGSSRASLDPPQHQSLQQSRCLVSAPCQAVRPVTVTGGGEDVRVTQRAEQCLRLLLVR